MYYAQHLAIHFNYHGYGNFEELENRYMYKITPVKYRGGGGGGGGGEAACLEMK